MTADDRESPTVRMPPHGEEGPGPPPPPHPGLGGRTAPDRTVILRSGKREPIFAWLAVTSGQWTGQLYRLRAEQTTIGRDDSSDIVFPDKAVSRPHARVEAEPQKDGRLKFFVRDLGSANRTWVNGQAVDLCALNDGDRIVIGKTALVFKQLQPGRADP